MTAMTKINFKTGTYRLHRDPNFNYQLNRAVMLSNAPLEKIQEVSHKITDVKSLVNEMHLLAAEALKTGCQQDELAFTRCAEFFMNESDPDKEKLYKQYKNLFYKINNQMISDNELERIEIPYENGYMPVIAGKLSNPKATILLHGGFDSYMEEFLPALIYFKRQGFSVYLFEGPGQGECIHFSKIPFTRDWDKPVGTVLDYFDLKDITLIGISLGSLLALRAAKDKRISHIAAWSIMPDFYEVLLSDRPKVLRFILGLLLHIRAESLVNFLVNIIAKKESRAGWGIPHGMYVFNKSTPYGFLSEVRKYTIHDVAPHIEQDVLLLGASNDHFIPLNMYKEEIDSLSNVKSMTFRVFTEKESAENHCNIGNMELVLKTISSWIETAGQSYDI